MQPQAAQPQGSSRKGLIIVIGLIVVALATLLVLRVVKGSTPTVDAEKSAVTNDYTKGVKFTAVVSSSSCYHATISMTNSGCTLALVGAKSTYVTIGHGGSEIDHPFGTTIGFGDFDNVDYAGHNIEVYAHKLADHYYTLEGSSDYYVKLLK